MGTILAPPGPADLMRQRNAQSHLVKRARAALLDRVANAATPAASASLAADFIEHVPDVLAALDARRLLRAVLGLTDRPTSRNGRRPSIDRMFEAAEVYGVCQLRELTYGQRCALAALLRARA